MCIRDSRTTVIHELFHCLAINHEGLRPEEVLLEHKGFQGGVLAIDHGTKRTGFAVTDALRISSFALDTFHGDGAGEGLLKHVEKLCDERTIGTFLVGFPYQMDGTEGGRAADVKLFTARLGARFPRVAIVLYDERDRKSTRLNSSHVKRSRMPSSA